VFDQGCIRKAMVAASLVTLLALAQPAAAQMPKEPEQWLSTEGKDAGWGKSTAKCRQLLGQLDLDDPVVIRWLPRLNARCQALRKVGQPHGWYEAVPFRFLEAMLEDLAKGVEPTKRYAGAGVGFPYWSEKTQRIESIWVHVPPGFDPAKTYQMFLYYKCGGGIHYKDGKAHGGYRPTVEVANQTDTFHVWSSLSTQVKGRMGAVHELTQAVAALARDFSVDPDRVFLTGWSDGGFTAIWLGSRYPHLVAGIAPCCANWQYTNVEPIGLFNVPMLAVDGWTDGGYNASQFIRWHALHTMGYDVAGLWGHHGHSYKPYEDLAEFRQILDWAKTKRRDLWPKRVRYATWNLTWHKAFWLSIERMADPLLPAQVDAEVKAGNRVEVKAWNIARYKLALSEKLLDPAVAVTVTTNGRASYSGPFRQEIVVDLLDPGEGKFRKCPASPGGITAQYEASTYGMKRGGGLKIADRKWLWVKPTGGGERTQKLLAKWVPSWAKADTALTEADIAGHNLFVLGGPDVNTFAARIAGDLPVRFGRGSFSIGAKVYDEPTHCVKFIHPNPLNPDKYVMVHAFNDAAAFAANGFFGLGKESAWGFRLGDCVVLGVRGRGRKWGVSIGSPRFRQVHHVFDSHWRPAAETPVGELASPLEAGQILRLRAEAIREAAGADVGIIQSYTPGYLRWRESLPAGCVSLHDLATLDALPRYVMVGEVAGADLTGLLRKCAASTVLTDKRHPAYEAGKSLLAAEIDPKKTYRVASACGLSAYRADWRNMPQAFFFNSPEEFLAGKHVSLPVRRLRQLPIDVTEAVADYIRKRKIVAPRPVCFDLAEYLADPQANEFGAYDWLHLGGDVSWSRPDGGTIEERYTLSLGLKSAADPPLGPPRKNSKAFLEVDLSKAGEAGGYDLAKLAGKLPVSAAVTVSRFAITSDAKAGGIALSAGEPAGQTASASAEHGGRIPLGRGVVLNVRLTNTGKTDVTGVAALSPGSMRRINGSVWPSGPDARKSRYAGLRQAIGPHRKPAVHQNAAVFAFDGPAAPLGRLAIKNVGYNFGLVAVQRTIDLKAGQVLSVPVLFVAVNKPASAEQVDLSAVLEKLFDQIMARTR